MSGTREICYYDYVDRDYERVRDVLAKHALEVFRAATKGAADRAGALASALRVNIAGVELATDIDIRIVEVRERSIEESSPAMTTIDLEWTASHSPRLFPLMHACLTAYRLSENETQLELAGHYDPPLGPLGGAIDSVMGHRLAEASVHRFLQDVAAYLRDELAD